MPHWGVKHPPSSTTTALPSKHRRNTSTHQSTCQCSGRSRFNKSLLTCFPCLSSGSNPVDDHEGANRSHSDFAGHYSYAALRPVAAFIPRPELHRQIKQQLHDGRDEAIDTRILVVRGLGGSGKSQLVLNYVQECRQDYSTIFWIEAGQKESIERDYVQIYRLLFERVPATGQETRKIEDVVAAVKSWFHSQRERSLVVLDSADEIDEGDGGSSINLEFFLPDAPTVDIIITTRHAQVAEITTLMAVDVGEMETTEAVELFLKCAKLKSTRPGVDMEAEVLRIVEELGRLALAITLAGSYVAATHRLKSDISLYLPEYRERRKQILGMKARKLIHRYGESVLSTWETSFAAVARQSVIAVRLLSLLAFLSFDDIFPALFERLTHGGRQAMNDTGSDQQWHSYLSPNCRTNQYDIEAAFGILQTYSLIQWRENRDGYRMHKLVHAWGHDRLEEEEQQHLSVAALGMLIETFSAFFSEPGYKLRLVPHVMANFGLVSAVYNSGDLSDTTTLALIAKVGTFLKTVGRLSDSHAVRRLHFSKTRELHGSEHPDTLTSMNNLASVLSDQGKYEQAEEMHQQELAISERVLGREHPGTLTSMNNLASVMSRQGKYEQAEEINQQKLALSERVLGREHPSTLTSMNNLASVLSNQGKYEQAEEIHRQALALRERVIGREHPDTLTSMNNLASVLGYQGKYEQAAEMHRQALALRERVIGREHPSTLTSMNNLALMLGYQGEYEQAAEMHRQALALRGGVLGREHPSTLTSMNNLASVLSNQGKYEQAAEMHRQALALRERVIGREHPDTLTSMNNLALVLGYQGEYEQAEEMHRQVLALRERVIGREHPDTLTSMNNLALVLGYQGEYEQAEEMHRQALALRERVIGREHPSTLTSMNNLALMLGYQGKYDQAEEIHRQVLALRERVLGREHPDTLTSMNNLALVLGYQGKYEQAEEMHRQVLALRERVIGREHPDTLTSMNNLALVLGYQGKYEQAEEIHRQVLAVRERVLGREHPDTLTSMNHLASVLSRQGKHEGDASINVGNE